MSWTAVWDRCEILESAGQERGLTRREESEPEGELIPAKRTGGGLDF
jgi:hypothetical protein